MEERLICLPDPVREVTIPYWFSISQIVLARDCSMRFLLQLQKHVKPLPLGPWAELGKIFHTLLEHAVKGLIEDHESSVESLCHYLDRLLNEARMILEKDPHTASYADLATTMTPLAWERKRESLVELAFEFSQRQRRQKYSDYPGANGFSFENAKGNGRWAEVAIQVPSLRLRGRIDLLEREGEDTRIIDLKSGRITGADQDVKPEITTQLLLYGIMTQTLDPNARVALVVNDGEEHEIPFDSVVCSETHAWLRGILDSLPAGKNVPADEHSKVGPNCRWCSTRHVCERYLREAPYLWTQETEWELPLDTWGSVEKFMMKSDDLVDVTLLDDAGRHVKIFGLRQVHLGKIKAGERIWMFGLATSRSSLYKNSWRHPLNFHEIDFDGRNRAWSLAVFGSNPS